MTSELEPVVLKSADRVLAEARREDEDVVARAAGQGVIASAARDPVVARASIDAHHCRRRPG